MISDFDFENKVLYFIHIPKTAGNSLESKQIIKVGHRFNVQGVYRLPPNKRGHRAYRTDRWPMYKYPNPLNYKITIIRNPFDLLCSYYFHGVERRVNGRYCHSGWSSANYTHYLKSFEQFIKSYCNPSFRWHQPALKKFLFSQLFDSNHNCVPDIIIKYEYLNDAIDILNEKLEHKITQRHLNKSTRKKNNYKTYYNQEMIDLVSKKCERELKYFNYDFEGSTKYEPLIINSPIKYNVHKNRIILPSRK